jgi:hypothetical protein
MMLTTTVLMRLPPFLLGRHLQTEDPLVPGAVGDPLKAKFFLQVPRGQAWVIGLSLRSLSVVLASRPP